jgi:hypothetical protein
MKVSDILRVKGNTLYTVSPGQLLAEGENTRNAKLIESAVQLVARYRAKISDAPALEVRADSLRQKFCKSAANRAADFVSSQPARGAGQLALRA